MLKKVSSVFLLFGCSLFLNQSMATKLGICHGEYALCASSGTTPTGKVIQVNGESFDEGMAVCPVLNGDSIADLDLMNGSCDAPSGKVWSLFSMQSSYPQAPTWSTQSSQVRVFTTSSEPGGGMSNMWSFLCDKEVQETNGATLARCYGPMNESPWSGTRVSPGSTVATQAPVGVNNPVAGNVPVVTA